MKYEWRKAEKNEYLPKTIEIVEIPKHSFLTIDGVGNPNQAEFGEAVAALYAVSYAIRMYLKKAEDPFEYTVYPLEGVWTLPEAPRPGEAINKDELIYRLMIRQPDQVTLRLFQELQHQAYDKKKLEKIQQLQFIQYTEGTAIQALHVGSYDTEAATFAKMQHELQEKGYVPEMIMEKYAHREIYLSDARRVAPEKQKTVLRYKIKPAKKENQEG